MRKKLRQATTGAEAGDVLVGIDVGGTFTDFVLLQEGALRIFKLSTTPDDQSRAIVAGLNTLALPPDRPLQIVHGMTVATNALLERRGARTALLTSAGFGDVLIIGRQNRPFLYRLHQERPPALVAEAHIFEVAERLAADGSTIIPLDEAAVIALADRLADASGGLPAGEAGATIDSLAIVFLFSFRNPVHEQRAAALLNARLPTLPISLSSAILPEYREYERTATTVINAYVQPLVARYLERLQASLGAGGSTEGSVPGPAVRIMQSNGGAIGLAQAAREPARLVLSGPAGGVVGAFAVAQQARPHAPVQLITFDMGGTSTDVALCNGAIPTTAESYIGDLPLRLPVIDIHTVGAGGGSVAFIDQGGALHVGPRSAGAVPGPAAYGRGGSEPTVTDANVLLGRLPPQGFLGGQGDVTLNVAAARAVLAALGERIGLSAEQTALGVIRVANATMERALRRVSVERGHDPRAFTLLPFGGAGPLHACDLADALGVRRILVPPFPGVLSAYGMLVAGIATEASQSILYTATGLAAEPAPLHTALAALDARVRAVLANEGVAHPTLTATLDLRYRGQSYELGVALATDGGTRLGTTALRDAVTAFHALHQQRYGYALPDETVEVVTLRLRAEAPGAEAALPALPPGNTDAAAARVGEQWVWFSADGPAATPLYDRARLQPNNRLNGPALILQYDTTTVLAPGWAAMVDGWGNLVAER
jgi:N-methylhydantoinase A